ncbi:FAD/NAD(P)-binding domain-containing protein [Mytilinidion resinicola]|uniref:FAD/NAD(P)-binding domain-containing protein n=1 Tax=Mytilinidion resinicola TaxID=574789 RepID=A0A6A6Z4I9_9PEZI|nr:FAD/NAD(P)-binding domain-containing protein [Mytilinidion resinicola]KAF2815573.1 FAD/NAD(P)-binding domain-containing protein [Mytilinidion resinicola]
MDSLDNVSAIKNIIVVGVGPAGLLAGLILSKNGLPVTLMDMGQSLDTNTRATHYAAPAVTELIRAGVIDDVKAEGFQPHGVSWRKINGEKIASLNADVLGDAPDRMVCLPLDKLVMILKRHLDQRSKVEILFDHEVKTKGGERRFAAQYIIGCEGANSKIRRSLFGDWEFPGFTWDKQVVATNDDSNFIVDPDNWFMAAKISNDGLWRVTYGDITGLTREELIARQPMRFKEILPGHPDPDLYKLANISPYKVHQRLAHRMRVGRFLLAADAAHLCNPFGGMGLTSGIVDVGGLCDCLLAIHHGKAGEEILDIYSEKRMEKYETVVDPISSGNFRRLFENDPEKATENNEFFKLCLKAGSDNDLARQLNTGVNILKCDFSQHFTPASSAAQKV